MSTLEANKALAISTDGINPSATPTVYFDGTNAISANQYSVPIWVHNKDRIGVHVSCPANGTPNGSLVLQATCDVGVQEGNNQPDSALVNWATLSFWDELLSAYASSRAVAGASSYLLTVQNFPARWLRVLWTNVSGTASLTIRAQLKGMGGR